MITNVFEYSAIDILAGVTRLLNNIDGENSWDFDIQSVPNGPGFIFCHSTHKWFGPYDVHEHEDEKVPLNEICSEIVLDIMSKMEVEDVEY